MSIAFVIAWSAPWAYHRCPFAVVPHAGHQGGALRAPQAGACARPLPWKARPARAGPTAQPQLIN